MKPLIAVIPYHAKDLESARNLLTWIKELGGCPGHSCILAADATVPKEKRQEIKALARQSFENADTIPLAIPERGYAPNHMFMLTAQQIMFSYKLPWLWLEPDAVPIRSGWLSTLSEEYAGSPKRLLGGLVESNQPGLPAVHLTGVSIYPCDVFPLFDGFASIKSANVAWDMEAASATVPRAKNSQYMQHFWGTRELAPTFVKETAAGQPPNALTLEFIKADVVLFHRNKDGTLIELLREQLKHETIAPVSETPKRRGRPPKNSTPITDGTQNR